MFSKTSNTLSSFSIIYISLIFSACLVALARNVSTILNGYGESGQHCLAQDFSGTTLSFFPFNLILTTDFLHIALLCLGTCLISLVCPKLFITKGCWKVYMVDFNDIFLYVEKTITESLG